MKTQTNEIKRSVVIILLFLCLTLSYCNTTIPPTNNAIPLFLQNSILEIASSATDLGLVSLKPLTSDTISKAITDGETPYQFTIVTQGLLLPGATETIIGRYTKIFFYDLSNALIYTLNQNFVVVSTDNLPSEITQPNVILNSDNSFTVEFNKPILPEYEDFFRFSSEDCIVKVHEISLTNKKLDVMCNLDKLDSQEKKFDVYFRSKKLSPPVLVTCEKGKYFDLKSNSCQSCSFSNAFWNESEEKCTKCVDKIVNEAQDGCKPCENYFNEVTNKCVTSCPTGTYINESKKKCTLKCNIYEENKCIEKCIEKGKDIITSKCIPIEITSVSKTEEFVANMATPLYPVITFNSEVTTNQINQLYIKNNEGSSFKISTLCSINSSQQFTCTIYFSNIDVGDYWLEGYFNNKQITPKGFPIKIKLLSVFSFNNKSLKLPVTNTNKSMSVTCKGQYNLINKFEFFNADTNEVILITNNKINQNTISFDLPLDLTEGLYKVKSFNESDEVIDISIASIMIYQDFKFEVEQLKVIKWSTMESFTLDLGISPAKSRIESVEFRFTDANTYENIIEKASFIVEGKTLKVTHTFNFYDSRTNYQLAIKETNKGIKPWNFELVPIIQIKSAIYNEVFIYSEDTPSFDVTFDEDIEDINVFGFIMAYTTGRNVPLVIKSKGELRTFTLELADPTSELVWGEYDGIAFYDKYTKRINEFNLIYNQNTPIRIYKESLFPLQLRSNELFFPEGVSIEIIQLHFLNIFSFYDIEVIDLEYIGIGELYPNIFQLTLQTPLSSNTTFTLEFLTDYKVEVKLSFIPGCEAPFIQDPSSTELKCISCDKYEQGRYPYYYKMKCYRKCPHTTVLNKSSKMCFDTCEEAAPEFAPFKYGIQCLTVQEYLKKNLKLCEKTGEVFEFCPSNYYGRPLFTKEPGVCDYECLDNQVPNQDNVCISIEGKQCLNTDTTVQCIEKCPPGTVFSNNKCVLPSFKSADSPSVQCTPSYCQSGGVCSVVNNQLECACPTGTYGLACEINESDIYKMVTTTISRLIQNEVIDFKHPSLYSQVRSINTIFKSNPNLLEEALSKQDYILDLSIVLSNTINKLSQDSIFPDEIITFIVLGLKAIVMKLKGQSQSLRYLLGETERQFLIEDAKSIVDDMYKVILLEVKSNIPTKPRRIHDDIYDLFTTHIWTNKPGSLEEYYQLGRSINFTTVNITDDSIKSYLIISSDYDRNLSSILIEQEEKASKLSRVNYYSIGADSKLTEINTGNVNIGIPFDLSLFNDTEKDNFIMYLSNGTNVYDANSTLFTDKCYFNRDLPFDIPQKIKYTIASSDVASGVSDCVYQNYDSYRHDIVLKCSMSSTDYYYKLIPKELNSTSEHLDNLPTLCLNKIDHIANNFGFWTYLWIIIIGLAGIGVLAWMSWFNSKNDSIHFWLVDNNHIPKSTERQETTKTDRPVSLGEIKIETQQAPTLLELLKTNFFNLYPLVTLCRQSVLAPNFFKVALFTYNILNYFGFNALFYNETMIADKITDDNRNNFGYPMKSEFEKIIYTILISIVFTMITRAIILITFTEREALYSKVVNAPSHEERHNLCIDFWKMTLFRRIIAYVFMLILTLFFFVYAVGFCGIYVKTQYTWFYSGLWTLFMNWVIFAPLSIVIISLVEYKVPICGYYAKQLFWF